MRRAASLSLLALTAQLVLWTGGCSRCASDGAVAELTAAQGAVEADDAAEPISFSATEVGRRFGIGEAVRTGVDATADLGLAGGGSLHVDPGSVVRFARTAGAPRLEVESGSTTLEAPDDAPIEVETVFGIAHLEARSRTRIGPGAERFEVVVGHATLERGEESVVLDMGAAVDVLGRRVALASVDAVPDAEVDSPATRTVEVRGSGAHVRPQGVSVYTPLAEGRSEVAEGSLLRADVGTTIEIATPDGHVRMDGDAEVELARTGTRASHGRFDVAGGASTRLEVPGGTIVLSGPGVSSAHVELSRGGSGTVTVRSGEVIHETTTGAHTLHASGSLELASGGIVREVHEVASPTLEDEPPSDTVAPIPSGPELHAAVTLGAGESVAVHDPNAPTGVRIEPPAGCDAPVWRIDGRTQPSLGSPALVASFRAGAHRYQLRCASGTTRRGTVRVDRDRGQAAMPRTAPRTVVDADGRPYSVLYQSLLPEIVLRWPRAPGAGPYEIEVQHGSATRRVRSPTASHTFASGEIGDGTTTLVFLSSDGSRSPPTTLRIRFDNATPIASIRAPAVGGVLVGTMHVEGAVAPGASVSVSGVEVEVDQSARFSGDVAIPEVGCISIRVALAGRGVHHYVRCGP